MNIQGEWAWVVGEKRVRIYQKSSRDVLVSISILKGVDIAIAIAERIVQTHNSFDELLEACKQAEYTVQSLANEGVHPHKTLGLVNKLKKAIAEAEIK